MSYRRWDREHRTHQIEVLADTGVLSLRAIARAVGCAVDTVRETLDPELRARNNRRRAAYAARRAAGRR